MLGNMLNDLAEAIRRWTEKKDPVVEILTKQLGSEMLVKSESASLKELVNQVRSAPYYRTGL